MGISLQSILLQHWNSLTTGYPGYVHRAAYKLTHCRTAVLGGHVLRCENGHIEGVFYNSCRHRCCPQCSSMPRQRWLERWQNKMLDTPAFHIVFTVPQDLVPLWRVNKREFGKLLMQACKDSLQELLADSQYLGALPGMIGALHTWSQTLAAHPHCHFLVTAGGLSEDGQWKQPTRNCLLPRAVLMHKFRGKFIAYLRKELRTGKWHLPKSKCLANCQSLLSRLARAPWNVKLLERYDHARGVTIYLAKYLRGGPISNKRLISLRNGKVRFSYLDRRDGKRPVRKVTEISAESFLDRWAQHVPPYRMHTMRAYGLYANSNRAQLELARNQLTSRPCPQASATQDSPTSSTPTKPECACCKQCGAPLLLAALPRDPAVTPWTNLFGNFPRPTTFNPPRAPPRRAKAGVVQVARVPR